MQKIILLLFISSCSFFSEKNINIDLTIKDGESYKYDLKNGIYTIYYMDKPPVEIKFKLTDNEKEMINNKYYEYQLDDLPLKIIITGNYAREPTIYTSLHIQRKNVIQDLKIEEGCSEFNMFIQNKARKVNHFIEFVYIILNSKMEIKNSKKSNILYL